MRRPLTRYQRRELEKDAEAMAAAARGVNRALGNCEECGEPPEKCRCAEFAGEPDEDCPNCGGTGYSYHNCGEDTCCCLEPEDNVVCDWCRGSGRCGPPRTEREDER